jgi:hypothetical protein
MQQNADNEGKHGDHVDHEGQVENERTHGSRAYPSEMGFPAPQSNENSVSALVRRKPPLTVAGRAISPDEGDIG